MKSLVLLLAMNYILADPWIPANKKLDSLNLFDGDRNFFGATLIHSKDQEQKFRFNFNFDQVLIPDKQVFNWGIQCDDSNPTCVMTNKKAQFTFDQITYKGYEGSVEVLLDKTQPAPTSKLDFVKVTEQTMFDPDQWAVIGLSPRSDFLSYLRANNQDVFLKLTTSITKAEGE